MGIPLDSSKRGEHIISLYTRYVGGKQTSISTVSLWWHSGFHPVALLRASTQWGRHPHEGVSLRVSYEASRHLISYEEYYANWRTRKMPSAYIVTVVPCCRCNTSAYSFFFHISCPLLHNFVDFNLTDLWSLLNYFFGSREAGKSSVNSSSRDAFNAKTRVGPLLAPFLMKASLCLLCAFPSYIYNAPSSFSFISFWLIFERETERDHRFWLRWLIFRHFIYRQSSGLSSECNF